MKQHSRPGAVRGGRRIDGERVVAIYEFGKALLLVASAYGVYRLLDQRLAVRLARWLATLTDQRERRLLQDVLQWFGGLAANAVHWVLWVSLLYAALALVEGVGLWRHRRWAEWLTVVSSGLLIPFEIGELLMEPRHNTGWVLSVLIINVAIVVYLATRLRHR
jgi:uncharacterized membrane protein (DUF2068 family)